MDVYTVISLVAEYLISDNSKFNVLYDQNTIKNLLSLNINIRQIIYINFKRYNMVYMNFINSNTCDTIYYENAMEKCFILDKDHKLYNMIVYCNSLFKNNMNMTAMAFNNVVSTKSFDIKNMIEAVNNGRHSNSPKFKQNLLEYTYIYLYVNEYIPLNFVDAIDIIIDDINIEQDYSRLSYYYMILYFYQCKNFGPNMYSIRDKGFYKSEKYGTFITNMVEQYLLFQDKIDKKLNLTNNSLMVYLLKLLALNCGMSSIRILRDLITGLNLSHKYNVLDISEYINIIGIFIIKYRKIVE